MTNRDELIEEAAKAAHESVRQERGRRWESLPAYIKDVERTRIRAALAVFEKAHTPTDDEREAHRQVIDLWFANWRSIGKVSPALEVAIDSLEGMVSNALDAGFRRSVPQGEPSDAQVQAALDAYQDAKVAPGWRGEKTWKMRAALRAAGEVGR